MPKPPPGFIIDPKESLPAGFTLDSQDSQDSQPIADQTAPDFIGAVASKEKGPVDDIGKQLALTGRYAAQGAAGAIGMLSDPIAAVMNQFLPESKQIKNFRDVIKDYLDKAGVPEPEGKAQKIIGQATELGFSAMGNIAGAAGAAKQMAGTGQAVAKQMAAAPGQQALGAAGAGAAGQAAAEAGAGPGGQIAASLAGGIAGAKTGSIKTAPKPKVTGIKEAEALGIDVMTSDVIPPRTVMGRAAQATTERIPVAGTGGLRQRQYGQREDAIRDVLRSYGDSEDLAQASDQVMRDLSAKRGRDLSHYSSMKKEVIERLNEKGAVPVDNTIEVVDSEIARLKEISEEGFRPGIELFERFKRDITNKDLVNVEQNRKLLGEAFKAADLATVRNEGEKSVSKIYKALRGDMGDFIKQQGEKRDFTKWKVANKRLAIMTGELKVNALSSTLKNGNATPELVQRLIFSTKPSDVRLLYKNLDPKGRANARMAILNRAVEKSTKDGELSPQKFKTQLAKLSNATGVFFKGIDKQQIKGLERALQVTKRAGESGVMTATGMQTVPFVGGAVLADIFGGWGGAVIGTGTIGALSRLYESKPVRDILLKLPKMKKGSAEEAAAVKRLIAVIQEKKAEQ